MSDDQKRKFDMIYALRSAASDSFNKRRDPEWRITLSLWTAFAALIGILLAREPNLKIDAAIKYGGAIVVAVLVIVHVWFLGGLQEANRIDRDLSDHYDDFIEREFLKVECQSLIENPKWHDLGSRRQKRRGTDLLTNYSFRFQLLASALFGACLILLLTSR